MNFAFWYTTRIGSVNTVPPPGAAPVVTPARAMSLRTLSAPRLTVGTLLNPLGESTVCLPLLVTCSVHCVPSYQRISCRPYGSGYHPGGCVDASVTPSTI